MFVMSANVPMPILDAVTKSFQSACVRPIKSLRGHSSSARQVFSERPKTRATWAIARAQSFNSPDKETQDFLEFIQSGAGTPNFGESIEKVVRAVDEGNTKQAQDGLAEARYYVEGRVNMAERASDDAAEFAAKAAMETREDIIPHAQRAVAAARMDAAEQQQFAQECREELAKLELLVKTELQENKK
mmetsp:Transcript_9613/g.18026  ORF Transcript_9613/g.18026 Transcript_9613/m.18026 type:complete len:188 (+) Transcript_9613:61-624(+)